MNAFIHMFVTLLGCNITNMPRRVFLAMLNMLILKTYAFVWG